MRKNPVTALLPTDVMTVNNILSSVGAAAAGYTCVPNDFFDLIAPTLKEAELRLMLYLYRRTYGFHKLTDRISYDQFQHGIVCRDGRRLDQGAGIGRRALVTALASLVEKGLITRDHTPGQHTPATYGIVTTTTTNTTVIHRAYPPAVDNGVTQVQTDHPVLVDQVIEMPPQTANQVQDLHPTKESFHDNMKESDRVVAVAAATHLEEKSVGSNSLDQVSQSAQVILADVPGISPRDATRLARLALLEHGRDGAYIARLVAHVMSSEAIRTPAAVLTALVKADEDRTAPQDYPQALPSHRPRPREHLTGTANMIKPFPRPCPSKPSFDLSKFAPGGKYAYLVAAPVGQVGDEEEVARGGGSSGS